MIMKRVLKEEIIKLRSEGKTYEEIRKVLNCTKSVISYHCKNAGIATGYNKPSTEEIEMANRLYSEGKNLSEVASVVGRTRQCIKAYIDNYNGKKYVKNLSKSQSVVNWRKRKKSQLVDYKGGKCIICEYNDCIEALSFHHLNPLEKDFTIGGKSWSFERLKEEVDKCVLFLLLVLSDLSYFLDANLHLSLMDSRFLAL